MFLLISDMQTLIFIHPNVSTFQNNSRVWVTVKTLEPVHDHKCFLPILEQFLISLLINSLIYKLFKMYYYYY